MHQENKNLILCILIGFTFLNMLVLVFNIYMVLIGKGNMLNLGLSLAIAVSLFVIIWSETKQKTK